jgi:hypothetical protein
LTDTRWLVPVMKIGYKNHRSCQPLDGQ